MGSPGNDVVVGTLYVVVTVVVGAAEVAVVVALGWSVVVGGVVVVAGSVLPPHDAASNATVKIRIPSRFIWCLQLRVLTLERSAAKSWFLKRAYDLSARGRRGERPG